MNIDKNKIEYVIGIDLGHGETSAAICPMQWDKPSSELEAVKDLEMGGNKKVIPSAITIIDDNTAYIGDSAFNPEVLKKATVRVCFKQAPKDINGEPEKLMMRFMKEVYNRIRQNNTGSLTDGNHIVYIATPSGWDKSTQQLYVKMAEKAGLPIAGVTKESRAAFVKAQQDTTSGIGRNVDKGAIVFDMGSSTLDFTYMNKNRPKPIDNGYNCGASRVEKLIFSKKEEESDAIKLFKKKYPKLIDYLLFESRKVKEQVYFDPSLKVKKTINFEDFIDDEDLEDERFKLAFQPGELNDMLSKAGYLKEIEDAMVDYKNKFIPDQKIYGVFLTGGASRMDFIKSLVSRCWNVPEEKVYRDQDPSLTISQGVAEVARMDLLTGGKVDSIEEAIDQLRDSDDIYNDFVKNFGDYLRDKVTGEVASSINSWTEADENYCINDLKNMISNAVTDTVKEESGQASEFIANAIVEHTKDIQAMVDDIVKGYAKQGISTSVTTTSGVSITQAPTINLDDTINSISQILVDNSGDWGDTIAIAAGAGVGVGVATALMGIGGPIGLAVGLGILGLKALFGEEETEEQKKAKAMSKSLDGFDRIEVSISMEKKWQDMCDNINESIQSAFTNDKSIKVTINDAVRGVLNEYKENLKSARILID